MMNIIIIIIIIINIIIVSLELFEHWWRSKFINR